MPSIYGLAGRLHRYGVQPGIGSATGQTISVRGQFFVAPNRPTYHACECADGNEPSSVVGTHVARKEGGRNTPIAADARVRSVAPENSFRLKAFYLLLPAVMAFFRERRMRTLLSLVRIEPGTRVLDLGGAPAIWEHIRVPLDITLLNLPGAVSAGERAVLQSPGLNHHTFHLIEGDACNVEQFADRSFDLVFSNSVIEHVGPSPKQAEFAREVRRLGKSYWVQTPSRWFPIEPHSGMPFYWFYPEWLRAALMRRWRKNLPGWWADYIGTTRVLSKRRLAELFPNAKTRVEYFLGLPKSNVAYARESSSIPTSTGPQARQN
jgi:ubiquinone/menaquinone biosynthesis C-methylase UbiE